MKSATTWRILQEELKKTNRQKHKLNVDSINEICFVYDLNMELEKKI